jgi:hypothetical protein
VDHIDFQKTLCRGNVVQTPMEDLMRQGVIAIAATLAIASMGLLVSGRAEAGGATSAPSKYGFAVDGAKQVQILHRSPVQTAGVKITEFSSSSAKSSAPKR